MKCLRFSFLLLLCALLFSCSTKRKTARTNFKTPEENYAFLLGVDKEKITNKKLYSFINEWYGVTYKYGGKSKRGVDCSGFASLLYSGVYEKEISGSSLSIYNRCQVLSKDELQEGDLVFFKIDSKDISHVGIYLQNNRFVHATTKGGVMIDSLDEDYYKKYFENGGRIK